MGNGADDDAFNEDEAWGAEDTDMRRLTCCSDGTDDSDFTPTQLVMMKRKGSEKTAPLPKGVKDVHWQPPVATGLDNSIAIFQTEADEKGVLLLSSEGISESNSHFRSWQEDNGVAESFASKTVEKEVDGKRITVAVSREPPRVANRLVRANTRANKRPGTMALRPNSAGAALRAANAPSQRFEPDVHRLRTLRKCFSAEEEYDFDDQSSSGGEDKKDSPSTEERSTGQPLQPPPSADVASQQASAAPPQGLAAEEGAVRGSVPGCRAQQPPGERAATPAPEGVVGGPSLSTTIASDRVMPATPHRPSDGVASSHARVSPRGQPISTQVKKRA